MSDEELLHLMGMNAERFQTEKEALYSQFAKMDEFIKEGFKKNAVHRHFKTKKECRLAMARDFNPFNTFSWGKKLSGEVMI